MRLEFGGEKWIVLIEKALFHPESASLILGDLHIGKASDLRKAGQAIPFDIQNKNILNLIELIRKSDCKKVIFLGDLFHSSFNKEFHFIEQVIAYFSDLEFILVRGNHEKDADRLYENLGLKVCKNYKIKDVQFIHEPKLTADFYHISGHLHPGIRLKDIGRMSVAFPVLAIQNKCMVLPAWGNLTGKYILKPKEWDKLYLFSGKDVRELG